MARLSIVDVAPILLRSVGLAPDVPMEGRCPQDLFDPSVVAQDFGTADPAQGAHAPEAVDDREVQADVLKRLRAIGYLSQ